ncbi:MAG: sulfatase-like hydrolase/transferase [Acidobacteriota bacterium]
MAGRSKRLLQALGVLLVAGCPSHDGGHSPHRSLLLITLDTTRADRLGAYGGRPGVSPTFDALARTGVLFQRCESASPLTLPSHATLLTGLYPPQHGLRVNGRGRLPPSESTLAATLTSHGFRTGAFVSSSILDRRHGLGSGFQIYDDTVGRTGERRGEETVRRALDWWSEAPNAPSFLWVHLFDPHAPYRPPPPFAELFHGRPYEGEIAYADSQIDRLLKALRKGDGSLVICIMGDHGEGLGEHGEKEHGLFLYQSTLSVPLVLASPELPSRKISRLVRTVDLFPTLLDLLGIPAPSGVYPGHSLLPLDEEGQPPRGAYAETLMPADDYGWSPLFAFQKGDLKIMLGAYPSLYDLKNDPLEQHDLLAAAAGSPGGRSSRSAWSLAEPLLDQIRRLAGAGDPLAPAAVPDGVLDQLRSLGYLGGGRGGLEPGGAVRSDPRRHLVFHQKVQEALARYRAGDFKGTARHLADLLREQPKNPLLLDLAGSTAMALGESQRAAMLFRAALGLSPERGPLEIRLAEALLASDRPREAASLARQALGHLPGGPPVRAALVFCRALAAMGRDAEAAREAARLLPRVREQDHPLLLELRAIAGQGQEKRHTAGPKKNPLPGTSSGERND